MADSVGLCAKTFNTQDIGWNPSRSDAGLPQATVRGAVEAAWSGDRTRLENIHYTLGCFKATGVPNADAAIGAFTSSAKAVDNQIRAQGGAARP